MAGLEFNGSGHTCRVAQPDDKNNPPRGEAQGEKGGNLWGEADLGAGNMDILLLGEIPGVEIPFREDQAEFRLAVQAKLGQGVVNMRFDGLDRDVQPGSDLAIGMTETG